MNVKLVSRMNSKRKYQYSINEVQRKMKLQVIEES